MKLINQFIGLVEQVGRWIHKVEFLLIPLISGIYFLSLLVLIDTLLRNPETANTPQMNTAIGLSVLITIGLVIHALPDFKIVRDWLKGE